MMRPGFRWCRLAAIGLGSAQACGLPPVMAPGCALFVCNVPTLTISCLLHILVLWRNMSRVDLLYTSQRPATCGT